MGAGSTQPEPLPVGTETRLAEFTELVATAIANAESRAELNASAPGLLLPPTRRGGESSATCTTESSSGSSRSGSNCAQSRPRYRLTTSQSPAGGGDERPRGRPRRPGGDIARHPPGDPVRGWSLAGAEDACPPLGRPGRAQLGSDRRLPEHVEVAGYYVVSEALTNAAKHAHASVVHVEVKADDANRAALDSRRRRRRSRPNQGSGLVGLGDRVEALGGRIEVDSPAGGGTSLLVRIPIEGG